jgi:hypothetical protein
MFAQTIMYTFGQYNVSYKSLEITVIMTLSSMVMTSNSAESLETAFFD